MDDHEKYGKIVFETENGPEEFYVLEQTMLGKVNYILVTDVDVTEDDPENEEGSFLILREKESEGDFASYEIPEDENEIKAVASVFNELLDDFDLEV